MDDKKKNPMDDVNKDPQMEDQQKGGEATATDEDLGDVEDVEVGEDVDTSGMEDTETEDTTMSDDDR